ncbi:hypothetical protein BDF22DRAFT_676564 [Syncephalis plumigaleata]|nr:hypothetical protein BDF22DRAFT_676564 [Syncephalis plumigaleata]
MSTVNLEYQHFNTIQYFQHNAKDLETTRVLYHSLVRELFFDVIMLIVFLHNFLRILPVLHTYKYKIAPLCCLTISITGVIYMGGFSLQMKAFTGPSCRIVASTALAGLTVNAVASSIFMMEHAYMVHNRNRVLLMGGAISALSCIITTAIYWSSFNGGFTPTGTCHANFPFTYSYVRYIIEVTGLTIFFMAFMYVVYRQYTYDKAACWSKITRIGVLTILLLLLIRLFFSLSIAFKLLGASSSYLLIFDWLFTSTLLSEYTYYMRPTKSKSTLPSENKQAKTYFSLNVSSRRTRDVVSFIKSS